MKRSFCAVMAVFMIMTVSSQVYAEGIKTGFSVEGSTGKFTRGLSNLADSLVEVPGTMMRKSKSEGAAVGMTFGVFEGAYNTVKRALAGVWEVVTFPIPLPENYDPILPDPEFLNVN
jgi:putative exosortase-associated protein (TIGR04073 family)